MPEPEVTSWLTHTVSALLGGGVGALLLAYVRFRGGISTIWRDERANVENEWARQVTRLNEEIRQLRQDRSEDRVRVEALMKEKYECHEKHIRLEADLKIREAESRVLNTQITILTAQLERLTKAAP